MDRKNKTQFSLTGFTQDMDFRVFAFEGVNADRTSVEYTVRADLGLVRKYGIRVQELPLLCRDLLDKGSECDDQRTLILSEDEMRLRALDCSLAREAAAARRHRRKPVSANVGTAWRGPQP